MTKHTLVLWTCICNLACGADVVLEDERVLEGGEGGFLGTGNPDLESAVAEACDLLAVQRPDCPQDTCERQATMFFSMGELTGCGAEAVEAMYCSVNRADVLCLGHHNCDSVRESFDDCVFVYCGDHPGECK